MAYTEKEKKEIVALVKGGVPISQVARDRDMSRTTITQWVNDTSLADTTNTAITQHLLNVANITDYVPKVIESMMAILNSEDVKHSVKIQAANTILGYQNSNVEKLALYKLQVLEQYPELEDKAIEGEIVG